MSESCCAGYFPLRLDSDLEIRIQRKLCGDTTTSFCVLQSQLINKAVCSSPLEAEPAVLLLASRPKVVTYFSGHPSRYRSFQYRLRSARYAFSKWNTRL